MSTMEFLGVGWRAARQAAQQKARERRSQHAGAVRARGRVAAAVGEHALTVLGLGCFVTAAALVAIPLALVVGGVACFVLELRMSGGSDGGQ